MKKLLVLLLLSLGAYWAYINQKDLLAKWESFSGKKVAATSSDDSGEAELDQNEEAEAEPDTVSTEDAPPTATSTATVGAPPVGIYFAKERLTQITDLGVSSIAAGTRVQKIEEQEGKFLVDDGNTRLLIEPWKLTRDPGEIAKLLPKPEAQPSATPPKKTGIAKSPASTRATDDSKRQELSAQIANIDRQIYALRQSIYNERVALADASGRGRPTSAFRTNISRMDAQISALETQRAQLNLALNQ